MTLRCISVTCFQRFTPSVGTKQTTERPGEVFRDGSQTVGFGLLMAIRKRCQKLKFVHQMLCWVLRDWISCLFSSSSLWAGAAVTGQPASEPAPLCADLLCNWKNWREADSGGYRLWSRKCLFSASVLNSLEELSRHSHLSPAPGKLLSAPSLFLSPCPDSTCWVLSCRPPGQRSGRESGSLKNLIKCKQCPSVSVDDLRSLCWGFAFHYKSLTRHL